MMFTATHFGNINPATVEHSLWQDLSANCSSIVHMDYYGLTAQSSLRHLKGLSQFNLFLELVFTYC